MVRREAGQAGPRISYTTGTHFMQHFDADYSERLCVRLEAIPPDRVPLWGKLRKQDLIEHLIWTLRHAMGRSTKVPDCSTWFMCRILKPLILAGIIRIPRNLHMPEQLAGQGIHLREPGDMETLQALLEEYLRQVQDDDLIPAPHPFFGRMSVDEWDRLHVLHFEHHLRQFNAPE